MKYLSAISTLIKKQRSVLLALCAAVVFITTYLLILPALTLEEDTADEQGGIDLPAVQLQQETGEASICAEFDAKAGLPQDTELAVSALDQDKAYSDDDLEAMREEALRAVQDAEGGEYVTDLQFAHFYDITLLSEGRPVEPDSAVDVTISYNKGLPVSDADHLRIVHFGEDGAEVLSPEDTAFALKKGKLRETTFAAESFSVYGVVYTVDFHYDVDGQTYDYSIEGGDTLSLRELLPILKVVSDEETGEFVDQIESVEFSDPQLIQVAKVEEDTTAGELKEGLGLEPEYSAKLSEEQRAEMDAKKLTAGDWALVTLKAFDTEEWLTITMADGEVFQIKVTDVRDPLGLNGRSFAIVTQRESGGNLGNWHSLQSAVHTNKDNRGYYMTGQQVTVSSDSSGVEYCDETATAWKFEYNADEDAYYISAGGKYLYIDPTKATKDETNSNEHSLNLVDSKSDGTLIKITANEDGTYCFENAQGLKLWNYGGSYWLANDDGDKANSYVHLCLPEKTSSSNPNGASHKASLTKVGDLQPGQSVVIYQRVRQPDNTFISYAIADDPGAASKAAPYRVWNSSDSVYWRGDPAILWKFTEATDADGNPNGYYYFVNEQTGRYLAAKADGTLIQDLDANPDFDDLSKVVKKEDHVQIALPGIRTDSYTSKIANWDYKMSVTTAPRVNDSNKDGTPEDITSEDLMDSQEFYFAVRDPIVQKQLTEVDTVNSKDKGITITMYDFNQNRNWTDTWGNSQRLPYMSTVMGEGSWQAGRYNPGLVSNTLTKKSDGSYGDWPTTTKGNRSLGDIFQSNSGEAYTVQSWDANHLFLQSVYDSTGYFRYSAFEDYARFHPETGNFSVYEQVGVPATSSTLDADWNAYYKKRGNFMPFDDPILTDPRTNEIRPYDDGALDPADPRQGEDLYRLEAPANRNYFFGMVMDAKFQQDKDGINSHGDPVRYDFNGDDDLWIYIDGVLVLDIGGVHDAFGGYIDFTTGDVVVKNPINMSGNRVPPTTIKDCFKNAGVFPDGTPWDDSLVDLYFRGNTFADYSSHDFKMIYMERGAGASNLEMQFNLTTLTRDQFRVTKDMPETETGHTVQEEYGNATFFYKAYRVEKDNHGNDVVIPIKKTDTVTLKDENGNVITTTYADASTYEDGKSKVIWHSDEIFELRPGHSAIFPVVNHGVRYYVEEVEPESETPMLDNYEVTNSSPEPGQTAGKEVLSDVRTVQQRSEVIYKNKPDDGLVNELRVTKKLHGPMLKDENGDPLLSEVGSPYFEYAIYLEDNDGKMVPYSLGPYYVIDKYGRFVYYTKDDSVRHYYGFSRNKDGSYSYYQVSPDKEGSGSDSAPAFGDLIERTKNPKVTEYTGEEGYLGDVRDGDTLVIVGLMEGTHFIVDEIKYGENDFLTLDENDQAYLDGEKYLFDRTEVEAVHVSGEDVPMDDYSAGHMFNDPDKSDVSVSEKAAEGDIRMNYDTEVKVHNNSKEADIPLVVKKNWDGVDPDDDLLKDTEVKVTIGRYTLKDKAATITIKKTGVPDEAAFSAVYIVRDSNGKAVASIPYSPAMAGEKGVQVNVLPGTYTVTEKIYSQDEGYSWTHDPENQPGGSGASVTTGALDDEGSETVTFDCDAQLRAGNLRIKSSYTIPNGGSVDFSKVTYTVYEGDETSGVRAKLPSGEAVPVISYDQAKGDGYLIEGLKAGTYTVREEGVPTSAGDYDLTDHTPAYLWHVTKTIGENATEEAVFSSTYTERAVPATIIVRWQQHWGNHEWVELLRSEGEYHVGDTVQFSYYRQTHNNIMQLEINDVRVDLPVGAYESGTPKLETRNVEIDRPVVTISFKNDNWGDMDPNSGRKPSLKLVANNASAPARMMMKAPALKAAGDGADNDQPGGESGEGTAEEAAINYGNPPTHTNSNKKYVDDPAFTKTVTLDQANDWEWSTALEQAGLPAADGEGNRYYYYIKQVEETGAPETTATTVKLDGQQQFIVGKDKHMTSQDGTLTPDPLEVNNVVKGSLKITKAVTVNGRPAAGDLTSLVDGVYTFTVTGVADTATADEQTRTVQITVSGGQAETIELEGLTPGPYVVTEAAATNGTALAGDNGITVTVSPGKVGANVPDSAKAEFTNNIETTDLTVSKIWSDGAENHAADVVRYTLYRVPYTTQADPEHPGQTQKNEYSPQQIEEAAGFTGQLSAQNEWTETVSDLPKTGEYTLGDGTTKIAVSYMYYIKETPVEGYSSRIIGGEEEGSYTFDIVNEPVSPTDLDTQVDIEKEWKNANGTKDESGHVDDFLTLQLLQKKYEARYKPAGASQALPIYPVTVNLYNGNRTRSDLSTVVFIPKGYGLTIIPRYYNQGHWHTVTGAGFDSPRNGTSWNSGEYFMINAVNEAREVSLSLDESQDIWSNEDKKEWSFEMTNSGNVILNAEDIPDRLDMSADPQTGQLDYTMQLVEGEDSFSTLILPGQNVPGQGVSGGVWKGSITHLPLFERDSDDGKYYVYKYELSEIRINTESVGSTSREGFDGETASYYVKWDQGDDGGWTITNQKKPAINVAIHKVDKDKVETGTPRLSGARFKLVKYTSLDPRVKDTGWDESEVTESTENPGIFSFTGLETGYYEIVETKAPDGYVRADENPVFQVRSNSQTNEMEAVLVHGSGEHAGQPIDGNATDMVKISNSADAGATVTFGNTPGAALPSSGGPGTTWIYLLGCILLLGCGITLAARRRARTQ